jgi:hypothetical protein
MYIIKETVPRSGIAIVKKHLYEYPECSDSLSGGKGILQEMVKHCTNRRKHELRISKED